MVDHTRYAYRVLWSDEDAEYVALCAEFPSLSYLAPTQTDALTGLVNLVGDVVSDMAANDEAIPDPIGSKRFSGKFQIRIPPEDHRRLAIEAAENGVSLNRLAASKLAS
jgi:predicted HicB family RNase H-like nuclease